MSTPRVAGLFVAALLILAGLGFAFAQGNTTTVMIEVDSVLALQTNEGVDKRLAPMSGRLHALFNFTTYRLLNHQFRVTQCGKVVSFMLPGGHILHVEPRRIANDMIDQELVLFQGERPMLTTDYKLRNHGTLMVGGPRAEQGMLIISISTKTIVNDLGPRSKTAVTMRPSEAATH